MAKTLWRLGSLGAMIAMAGFSWLVEACAGKQAESPRGRGGSDAGSTEANTSIAGTSGTDASIASGGSSLGSGGAMGIETGGNRSASGGARPDNTGQQSTGGLHDVPCE